MAGGKFLNLIALTALALIASSFGPTPVNALSTGHQHLHRHIAHDVVAKRKRDAPKRCKQRPTSSAVSSSTHAPPPPPSTPPASSPTSKSQEPPKTTAVAPPPPSPPKTTAASPPPPSPPASSGGGSGVSTQGGKLGLAWANGDDSSLLTKFVTSRVHSMYTWGPNCPENTDGIKCMPMMWGDKDASQMSALLAKPATDANNLVLFINEPNESGQANMSPQHACDLYHQYLKPAESRGYQYIAPAVSSDPDGLKWVKDFYACCQDCKFIGQALHWYDMSLSKFQDYINLWHTTFGMDIYVTEYALQNFNGGAQATYDEVVAFHKAAAAWMDQQSFIKVFMPFGFMNDMSGVNPANQLMSGNAPNALGNILLNGLY